MDIAREVNDPLCLSPESSAALLKEAPWRRFGVVGDSLSAGVGQARAGYEPTGWADRVDGILRRVHPELVYENTAVVGATTAETLDGLPSWLSRFEPDLLHVPSGANDLLGKRPDFAAIEHRLSELYDQASDAGALVTAFTFGSAFVVPSFDDWRDRVLRVNEIIRRLATQHEVVLVDMWAHPVNDRPDLVSDDGIHFSTMGQAVLASEVVKGLAERLAATPHPVC